MAAAAAARRRYADLGSRRGLHLIEARAARTLRLYDTGTSALSFRPPLEQLDGVRVLAVDRLRLALDHPCE